MSVEVHVDWLGGTHFVGHLHAAERGTSVSFEYASEWLLRPAAFAIDPASLPLRRGVQHAANLFGAFQDCGPDRWGRVLIERAVARLRSESRSRNGPIRRSSWGHTNPGNGSGVRSSSDAATVAWRSAQ